MRAKYMLGLPLALVAAVVALAACGGDDEDERSGTFEVAADAPEGFEGASGTAEIVRSDDGTEVRLDAEGLEPNTEFASHLHAGSCDQPDPGGPHFKFDLDGSEMPPNEIHLPFTSDADGHGSAEASNDQRVPDEEGKSVVIHLAAVPHEEGEHGRGDEHGERSGGGGEGHTHQPKALCADLEE